MTTFAAGTIAAVLLWAGPPGVDLAAHAYQRSLLAHDGFVLWNNFWYAGRYSFVTYSFIYYPLAVVFGIKALALATICAAALAFTLLVWREWGPVGRLSSRTFAVLWAGIPLSAAFPFALGVALALLGLTAMQRGRVRLFGSPRGTGHGWLQAEAGERGHRRRAGRESLAIPEAGDREGA